MAWSRTLNWLGNALFNTSSFDEAVDVYQQALTVLDESKSPTQWACVHVNLAIALTGQAERCDGSEARAIAAKAVEACRAAMSVFTAEGHPFELAQALTALGQARLTQADNSEGWESIEHSFRAANAFRHSLNLRPLGEHPVAATSTLNDLAIALIKLRRKLAPPQQSFLLREQLSHFETIKNVVSTTENRRRLASTKVDLANTLLELADIHDGADGETLRNNACSAARSALEVLARCPRDRIEFARANYTLGDALFALARFAVEFGHEMIC